MIFFACDCLVEFWGVRFRDGIVGILILISFLEWYFLFDRLGFSGLSFVVYSYVSYK